MKYPYQNLELKDLPGEKWEDIPWLDGAYRVSNYGRVKSLRRLIERPGKQPHWTVDRVLKLNIRPTTHSGNRKLYRVSTGVHFEGKRFQVSVARLMYYLFIKKFDLDDRHFVISFKDENGLNLVLDNLILTTPSVNITKAYKKGYRERTSFGNDALVVSRYDLTGKWLHTYPSITDAAKTLGICSSQISEALNNRNNYSSGYIWQYGKRMKHLSKIPQIAINKLATDILYSKIISQYDLKGNKVAEFANLKVAAKTTRIQKNQIRLVLLGKAFTSGGFYWKIGSGPNKIPATYMNKRNEQRRKTLCRAVSQYNLQGNKVNVYNSIADAARAVETGYMNIFSALKQSGSTAAGFMWRYGTGIQKIAVPDRLKALGKDRR